MALPKLFSKEDNYNPIFLKVSQETGTPVSTLKGFVALESAFDERSYRYEAHIKDASYGLAQILASTARGVGFKGEPSELFDPYKSLFYGSKFIRNLAQKYPSLFDLIAAYNAGFPRKITATTKLIANIYKYPIEYRDKPPADWVYANEPYVRRVASYIAYYQAKERNDVAKAREIYDLIKKKVSTPLSEWSKYLIGESRPATSPSAPQSSAPSAPTLKPLKIYSQPWWQSALDWLLSFKS